VLWKTVTGDGQNASAPDTSMGWAAAIPEGIVAIHGDQGEGFALLAPDDGKVRWQRKFPNNDPSSCSLRNAAGGLYVVCQTPVIEEDDDGAMTITRLDPATGETRWNLRTTGTLDILGHAQGRLVLAGVDAECRALPLIDISSHVLSKVRLSRTQPAIADPYLAGGTVYFTLISGTVRAFSPQTGKLRWESRSTVEQPSPPTASATHVYPASPTGRLAAIDARDGKVEATLPSRDDGISDGAATAPAPVLVGDALYVPYGVRSVYTVDVRTL
jgi:outer membrane protein assembly factor BamB